MYLIMLAPMKRLNWMNNTKLMVIILIGFAILCFQFITVINDFKRFNQRMDKLLDRIDEVAEQL